jgi:NADPH-dependent curcumin reductase CurA
MVGCGRRAGIGQSADPGDDLCLEESTLARLLAGAAKPGATRVLAVHRRANRQVRLKSRPSGIPQAEHFEIVEAPVPAPSDGQVLVRNIYLSVDPAMRGWVSAVANYSEPVALGAVMRSLAVGRVEESRSSDLDPGDYVVGMFGWQDYAVVDAEAIERKVGGSGLPISTSLGVLGLNGLTAYFALLDIGRPKAGETVVVSTAAGAVGSCVGQIAKIKGGRAVGIAGGPDKVRMCREEFGYDAAVDYKADDFESALDAACAGGVDVYFDNTAGPISDSVMRRINVGARLVICGTASIASWEPPPRGPRVERHLLVKRARMQGFLIFDHVERYPEALRELERWVRSGQIRYQEDVLDGLEQAPDSIAGLYRGENLGKRLIRIAPEHPD